MTELKTVIEHFPLSQSFAISRGAKTEAITVWVALKKHGVTGQGECVPYARYGETPETVAAQIEALRSALKTGLDREGLQNVLPAGAARNAVDCAFWNLEAKTAKRPIAELMGVKASQHCQTAQTISLDSPEEMAKAAAKASSKALLKVKVGGEDDLRRLEAIRAAAPDARLIVDANEGWTPQTIAQNIKACAALGISLIEQPLPSDDDAALNHIEHLVPICADESAHDRKGLADLKGRYDAINIKLDKTGGLTEAHLLAKAARDTGLKIMIGCMVSTSLSMMPALMLQDYADWIDLDGPLWLKKDRSGGLIYQDGWVSPAANALWGLPKN